MKNNRPVIVFFLILTFILFLYSSFSYKSETKSAKSLKTELQIPINPVKITKAPLPVPEETIPVTTPVAPSKTTKIIAFAKSKLNLPYKQAGTTDKGYDCSGLIMMAFKKEGVLLPRASYQMVKKGTEVALKDAKAGDLIFFATNARSPNRVNHVGLITSVKEGTPYFIHSSTSRGVVINHTDEEYYKKSFIKVKRILKDD